MRAYDAFVDALDLNQLGIACNEHQVGNAEYEPRAMLKLLIYGYSYSSERSSRKLERALYHNLSFKWLVGGLCPDHKTIANFRRRYASALRVVLKQTVRMCLKMGLIEGNTLFIDGTKLRANASLDQTWNGKRIEETLRKTDERIEQILSQCEQLDAEDENAESLVKLKKDVAEQRSLKERVEAIAQQLKESGRTSLNTTDAQCVSVKGRHGSYAGYNAQIAVDKKNGLIASSDVVASSNDEGLLSNQIRVAEDTMGKQCQTAVADAGYSALEDLSKIEQRVAVMVPLQRQTDAEFVYNEQEDTFRCPEGQVLRKLSVDNNGKNWIYRSSAKVCRQCCRFGKCTKSASGRSVRRSFFEDTAQRIAQRLKDEQTRATYRLRSQKAELPFGHLRRNLGLGTFLLRGLMGVRAEWALCGAAFNLRRMLTLTGGVQRFIAATNG